MMKWLLVVLLILYPVLLTDFFGDVQPLTRTAPRLNVSGARENPKPVLQLAGASAVDRDAFLASFSRQSSAELVTCLQQQGERTGNMTLLARLNKEGKLTATRIVSPKSIAKECVINAIQKMEFAQVAAELKKQSVEIAWRFEW